MSLEQGLLIDGKLRSHGGPRARTHGKTLKDIVFMLLPRGMLAFFLPVVSLRWLVTTDLL